MNNLTHETEKRQRLEAKLSETLQELNETRTKLKSKEKLLEMRAFKLELEQCGKCEARALVLSGMFNNDFRCRVFSSHFIE